jgi:hypothetical protein
VAIGRNVLVRMRAGTEEVSQFIMAAAEPGGRSRALEAPHGPVAAFDAPVVLLDGLIANLNSLEMQRLWPTLSTG